MSMRVWHAARLRMLVDAGELDEVACLFVRVDFEGARWWGSEMGLDIGAGWSFRRMPKVGGFSHGEKRGGERLFCTSIS